MVYSDAFDVVAKNILRDKGLYIAWQSNIAMSFYDAMINCGYRFPELHKICNDAADNFLNILLRPPAKKQGVGKQHRTTTALRKPKAASATR